MRETDLIQALLDPAAYSPRPAAVDVLQTHASMLFFADKRVYKVKKAVDLGFLDFSTIERRQFYCQEEVRLNRRLAPRTYLGVVPITQAADGRVRIGDDDGEVIEYAVEMERLPAERMLSALLERGEADAAMIERLADRLVRFHAAADAGGHVDQHATPDAVANKILGNLDGAAGFAGTMPDQPEPADPTASNAALGRLRDWSQRFLDAHGGELRRRVESGRIREGHGDLHAGNICVLPDRLVIYDCIEFEPGFRCCDVAADIAFLGMDLDRRGAPRLADRLIERYTERSNDHGLAPLQPLYRSHFAAVRGKVDSIRAREQEVDPTSRRQAWTSAFESFVLALGYTLAPSLVVMCGLPGAGKSHVADALGRALRADVVRSDVIRKRLAGHGPADRPPPETIYTREHTERTYEAMRAQAAEALRRGRHAVLDATHATASMRAGALHMAQSLSAPSIVVEAQATEDVIEERMRRRAGDPDEPSDADLDVYRSARARYEPPDEVPPDRFIAAPDDIRLEVSVSRALDALAMQSRPVFD